MSSTKLEITDLSLLKITRVRNWSICFDYDKKHYLLHGCYECGEGSWNELFERTLDSNGKYTLFMISSAYGMEMVALDYIKKQKGETIVYNQIDKSYFAYKLTERGLVTGLYSKEVEKERDRKQLFNELKNEIQKLEIKAKDLNSEKLIQLRSEIQNLINNY